MTAQTVGIGELGVLCGADCTLRTLSLGSCVAVVMLDRVRQVAAMAHIVLPSSEGDTGSTKPEAYFADVAVPRLLTHMAKHGSGPKLGPLHVVLVGGSRPGSSAKSVFNIGERNVAAARAELARIHLIPVAEDIGGTWSRTVTVHRGEISITCPDRPALRL